MDISSFRFLADGYYSGAGHALGALATPDEYLQLKLEYRTIEIELATSQFSARLHEGDMKVCKWFRLQNILEDFVSTLIDRSIRVGSWEPLATSYQPNIDYTSLCIIPNGLQCWERTSSCEDQIFGILTRQGKRIDSALG